MTAKMNVVGNSATLALSALFAMLVLAPVAGAQMHLGQGEQQATGESVDLPDVENWCRGSRCEGRTCDEGNDRCVGTVTLQPPAGEPLVGLKRSEQDRFAVGKEDFNLVFGEATGLGPVFNQNSCSSCHNTPIGGSGSITVTRFGHIDVVGSEFIFDPLESLGGSLLNKSSIDPDNCGEVIPLPETNVAANRLTNSTLGFGLVEAILDADIAINEADPPLGVSGRVHIVPVLENPGETGVGRFGWKCQLKTVLSFSADASIQEMGITNRILTEDNPPQNDLAKLAACDTVPDPEEPINAAGDHFVDTITDFQRFLAPPPQTPRSGMTGETVFNTIGCNSCHMRSFVTPDDNELEKAIRNKPLYPYSDFLLHDMAFAADLIEQGGASLFEIRSTPLWGLRLRDPLWHDGRVGGGTFDFRIRQAINQHAQTNSESQASALAFQALSSTEQDQLIAFMDSLGKREFDMDGDGFVDGDDVLIVNACFTQIGPYTPDDVCAIADADQNGFVDDEDLDLLNVALGMVDDENADEDEDTDDDDDDDGDEAEDGGDGPSAATRVVSEGTRTGGGMSLGEGSPSQGNNFTDGEGVSGAEEDEDENGRDRRSLRPKRRAGRRGL